MSVYTQKVTIGWDDIKQDCAALAVQLREKFVIPDKILAVTRGGLIPAALVTRALGIKHIDTIGLESYHGQKQEDFIKVLKACDSSYLQNTLILDDLVDTGKTYMHLKGMAQNCIFATLYAKPAGAHYTDCYVRGFDQNQWVEFPWEMGE